MSDLFTEREHYVWMLNISLDLSLSHHHEDLLLHQYVIIAAAKAMAVSRVEVKLYSKTQLMVWYSRNNIVLTEICIETGFEHSRESVEINR